MRITDLLDARSILLNASPKSKNEALDQIVDLMVKSEKINDKEAYRKQVYAREEESTTGIGEGIAIPHGKGDCVSKPGLAAMVIKNGVDFDSLDGDPVTLLFLIAAPNTEDNVHLEVLSKLSMMLMDEQFTADLLNAKSVDEFLEIVDKADDEKSDIDVFITMSRPSFFTRMNIKEELQKLFHRKVDLITLHENMFRSFRQNLERDAIYI